MRGSVSGVRAAKLPLIQLAFGILWALGNVLCIRRIEALPRWSLCRSSHQVSYRDANRMSGIAALRDTRSPGTCRSVALPLRLSQMLLEEGFGAIPGEVGVFLVVAACGVVVESVVGSGIHVHLVVHFVLLQVSFVVRPAAIDASI